MFLNGLFLASLISAALLSPATAKVRASRPDGYQVVHAYPHDPNAFTQGLVYVDGHLYESTGLNGHSSLRMVDLQTGKVLQHHELPAEYFGEGLTNWGGTLVQLTWKAGTAFVYDRFSFALQNTLHYPGEGWGLTHDGNSLIMSDGSSVLRFLDPRTFRETRRLSVRDENGRPLLDINELEYIRGEIYANVWRTDRIARISPRTGKVLGWIDLSGLMDKSLLSNPDAVLNGIAYDSKWDRLFITGKLWPKLFEIKVVHQPARKLSAPTAGMTSVGTTALNETAYVRFGDEAGQKRLGYQNGAIIVQQTGHKFNVSAKPPPLWLVSVCRERLCALPDGVERLARPSWGARGRGTEYRRLFGEPCQAALPGLAGFRLDGSAEWFPAVFSVPAARSPGARLQFDCALFPAQ